MGSWDSLTQHASTQGHAGLTLAQGAHAQVRMMTATRARRHMSAWTHSPPTTAHRRRPCHQLPPSPRPRCPWRQTNATRARPRAAGRTRRRQVCAREGGVVAGRASAPGTGSGKRARAPPPFAARSRPPPPASPPPLWRGAGEEFDDARELAPLTPAPAPCGGTACAPALLRLLAHAAAVPGPFWRPVRTLPQFDSHLEPWVLGASVAFDNANLHAHPLSRARARVCVQTRVRGAPPVCASLLSGVCALVSKSRGVCLQRWNFPRELQLYASRGSALALHVRA